MEKCTVKQENCAVVLLYILMVDTPTIDVMWIFPIYVDFWQVCRDFYCAVNHCPHV